MKEIEDFSRTVASNIEDNDGKKYGFDPTLIIIIGSILINVLSLLVKCHVFGSLENRVKNPGPIDSILLNRAIKKGLPPEYAHLKDKVKESIIKSSQSLSSAQISTMLGEAKNEGQS